MIGGWTGTVLRVNLTRGTIKKEPLREDWAREYVAAAASERAICGRKATPPSIR